MIVVLLVLVVLVAAAVVASRYVVLPIGPVRAAAREVRDVVDRGAPYAYQYVLAGPGGPDVGDHDTDKLVVRADWHGQHILVRVAPVDRAGKRTGRSRLLLSR